MAHSTWPFLESCFRPHELLKLSIPSWCLHEGEPALLKELALVRRLDFTSILHGKFLVLLAGLDIARVIGGSALLSVFT